MISFIKSNNDGLCEIMERNVTKLKFDGVNLMQHMGFPTVNLVW